MFGFVVLRHDSNSGILLERQQFVNNLAEALDYAETNNREAIGVGYWPEYSVWYEDGNYRVKVDPSSGEEIE